MNIHCDANVQTAAQQTGLHTKSKKREKNVENDDSKNYGEPSKKKMDVRSTEEEHGISKCAPARGDTMRIYNIHTHTAFMSSVGTNLYLTNEHISI